LTECELVSQKQQGREIYYQLEINKMKQIDKWLAQLANRASNFGTANV
jgi:hypothetical protein